MLMSLQAFSYSMRYSKFLPTEKVEHVLIQCGQYDGERDTEIQYEGEGTQELSLKSIVSRTSLDTVKKWCYIF